MTRFVIDAYVKAHLYALGFFNAVTDAAEATAEAANAAAARLTKEPVRRARIATNLAYRAAGK